MIRIKDKKDCTGCHACASACPTKCITLNTDTQGFHYPEVEVERCIACGRCERTCPVLHPYEAHHPIAVYASKNADEEVRMQSSSGGLFTPLAEEILGRGGVLFGARFDDSWRVVHDYVETVEGLSSLRGTKYVQSYIGDTFVQVRNFLKQDRWVLFTGTPCQVAGLKHYLHRDYGRLLTVEVVCHGVPSPLVWNTYLNEITTKNERIIRVEMRHKSTGWSAYSMQIASTRGMLYNGKARHNVYSRGFLADFYLRPSCHACPAKQGRSGADITLGDYWGIRTLHPSMDDDRGVSLVAIHTEKGMNFFGALHVISKETTYAQALQLNPALARSAPQNPLCEEFWRRFPREGMKAVHRLWWKKRFMRLWSIVKKLKTPKT